MPEQAEQLDRLTAALASSYRLERELGAGGMATVYLAEDLKHKRKAAVKVLRPELAAVLRAERPFRTIRRRRRASSRERTMLPPLKCQTKHPAHLDAVWSEGTSEENSSGERLVEFDGDLGDGYRCLREMRGIGDGNRRNRHDRTDVVRHAFEWYVAWPVGKERVLDAAVHLAIVPSQSRGPVLKPSEDHLLAARGAGGFNPDDTLDGGPWPIFSPA